MLIKRCSCGRKIFHIIPRKIRGGKCKRNSKRTGGVCKSHFLCVRCFESFCDSYRTHYQKGWDRK